MGRWCGLYLLDLRCFNKKYTQFSTPFTRFYDHCKLVAQDYSISVLEEVAHKYMLDSDGTESRNPIVKLASENQASTEEREPEHYWGQALQHLKDGRRVTAGDPITLIAERERNEITFRLEGGREQKLPRAPWVERRGEGSSLESAEVQHADHVNSLIRNG